MQRVLALTLGCVCAAGCGSAANNNANTKTPTPAQAAQVSAIFAGQMTSSASAQGSSQTSRLATRGGALDPNCSGNDPAAAANDPNCAGQFPGGESSGSVTISLSATTIPCDAGGNVVQSGNMTVSQDITASGGFSMSGDMALEAVYHSCAMPAPDGNTYTLNAPGGVAQDMNMNMVFPAIDPNTTDFSNPIFPQLSMTSSVVGNDITVYAADGSVIGQGAVNLSMSIALDANGTGYVHFSGTQFGLAVDANQTFTPTSQPGS